MAPVNDPVAVVATGEMGAAVGGVLRAGGADVLTSLQGRSERTAHLAAGAGITDAGSLATLVSKASIFISIVPPSRAFELADLVADMPGPNRPYRVYIDCNAISPETAKRIGRRIEPAGWRYVDGGIIGFPPKPGPQATRIWVSGPDVTDALRLNEYGLDFRSAGSEIGQASALKMCYAALTKGLTAIGIQSFATAARLGLADTLQEELTISQANMMSWLERMVTTSPPKAYRWIGEMEEIAATFAAAGFTPAMFVGAADVYRFLAVTGPGCETPENRRQRDIVELAQELAAELNPASETTVVAASVDNPRPSDGHPLDADH